MPLPGLSRLFQPNDLHAQGMNLEVLDAPVHERLKDLLKVMRNDGTAHAKVLPVFSNLQTKLLAEGVLLVARGPTDDDLLANLVSNKDANRGPIILTRVLYQHVLFPSTLLGSFGRFELLTLQHCSPSVTTNNIACERVEVK